MGLRAGILKRLAVVTVASFLGASFLGASLFGLTAVHAGTTGKIAGVVEDAQNGDALASACIAVLDTDLGTVSDDDGRFFILNVPPGMYTLKVSYIGYAAYTIQEVRVSTDLTTDLDTPADRTAPARRLHLNY